MPPTHSSSVPPPEPLKKSSSTMVGGGVAVLPPNNCAPAPAAGTTACPPGTACPPAPGAPAKMAEPARSDPAEGAEPKAKRSRGSAKKAEPPAQSCDPSPEPVEDLKQESGTWLIVAKAVRLHLKNNEVSMHCGSDALPELNAKLADLIKEAIQRAQANGRKTLKACDF